jgi:endonuclease/exonuclease/phosphatase family metal-dependent hydrolase
LLQIAPSRSRRHLWGISVLALAALAAITLIVPATSQAAERVRVMTRNVYLGASLSPGTSATSLQELVNAAGVISNEVDANKFQVRARGLAQEILNQNPDLVGLQEAALWRDAPCSGNPVPPSATQVRPGGDFLGLLLNQLNKNGPRYRLVISKPEFDFQVWANIDGDENTGSPFGCEVQGRLTMRDAILARRASNIRTSNARRGTFDTLLQLEPGGVPTDITRGWTSVDAKIRKAPRFRFVNTHLEAFDNQASNHTNQDTDVGNGRVRQAQARELVAPGGPAVSSLPVMLLGDFNSDVRTPQRPGDQLAHQSLLNAGFVNRDTYSPLSCCLESSLLTAGGGGSVSDFDHKVDAVLTDAPGQVTLVRSTVTGRFPVNGFWSSDHAGIASAVGLRPQSAP